MADKLRIGIVGTGGIAHAHMNQYIQMDDEEIIVASDIVPCKARTTPAPAPRWRRASTCCVKSRCP